MMRPLSRRPNINYSIQDCNYDSGYSMQNCEVWSEWRYFLAKRHSSEFRSIYDRRNKSFGRPLTVRAKFNPLS